MVTKNNKTKPKTGVSAKAKPEKVEIKQASLMGLLEKVSNLEDDGEPRSGITARRARYDDAKQFVKSLEKINDQHVYLIPSATGEDREWYMMGDNSALFYKYILGPRMGRRDVVIRLDTDNRRRFKIGVATIRWIDNFVKKVQELGYEVVEGEHGVVAVKFDRPFTSGEVKGFRQTEKEDSEKLVTMLKPAGNYPKLYTELRELTRYVGSKVARLRTDYREAVGSEMMKLVTGLFRVYFETANGEVELEKGVKEMKRQLSSVKAMLAVMDELSLFDPTTRARMGQTIVDTEAAVKEFYKKYKGKKYVRKETDGEAAGAEAGQDEDAGATGTKEEATD